MEMLLTSSAELLSFGMNLLISETLHIFAFQLYSAKNEDVLFAILEEFNIDLYSRTKAEKATNSLHVAAGKGYTRVVELALERGFTKLLTYSNEKDQYPVQVALEQEHFGTAALMLRAMND